MTRKRYFKKLAYIKLKIIQWTKEHQGKTTDDEIKKLHKSLYKEGKVEFKEHKSYKERYEAIYNILKGCCGL